MSDKNLFGQKEEHPSYGMLSFSRHTSNYSHPLFGSSVKHKDTIHLKLKTGSVKRHLNQDWYFGEGLLFDVEMSYSQFAQLITCMNIGDGVPVTIRKTQLDRKIPDCPFKDKASIHREEFQTHLDKVYGKTKQLISKVTEIFPLRSLLPKKIRKRF